MGSRDENEKSYNVPLPDNSYITVFIRDSMTTEEFLASACIRKGLNPMEHFVRVKKRRDMEDHNYFVPHRNDLIETYVRRICDIQLRVENLIMTFLPSFSSSFSCIHTKSLKFARRFFIKSNYNDQHSSKCGDSLSRLSSSRMLTVKMSCAAMSVVLKIKVSLYKMVSRHEIRKIENVASMNEF